MTGQRRQSIGVVGPHLLEGLGHTLVRPPAPRGPEVLVEGVLDEGVHEAVAVDLLGLDDQPPGDRLLDLVDEAQLVDIEEAGQHGEIEVAPDHRGHRKSPLDLGAQIGHAVGYDLSDAPGESDLVQVGREMPHAVGALDERPVLGEMADQLDDEEGVASRLSPKGVGKPDPFLGHRVARCSLQQADDLDLLQPAKTEALHRRLPAKVCEERGEGMRSGEIAVSEGSHHRHPHGCRRPGQMTQELETGRVGPVEIVEHDEKRRRLRHGGKQPPDALHHQEPLGVGICDRGRSFVSQSPRQGRHEAAEGQAVGRDETLEVLPQDGLDERGQSLRPRLVRNRQVLVATAVQDARPGTVCGSRRLGDERGLADAWLARDQHDADVTIIAAALVRLQERLELQSATEEGKEALGRRGHQPAGERQLVALLFRLCGGRPLHLDHFDGFGQALELDLTL